jgi:hypothetical protein
MKNFAIVNLWRTALIAMLVSAGCIGAEESAPEPRGEPTATFDIELSVDQQKQAVTVELTGESVQKLETISRLNGVPAARLLTTRLQNLADQGKSPFHDSENAARRTTRGGNDLTFDGTASFVDDGEGGGGGGGSPSQCLVWSHDMVSYQVISYEDSCRVWSIYDIYTGYWNTCTNSWNSLNYAYTAIFGPYQC